MVLMLLNITMYVRLDSSFSWWPWFVTGLVVFSSVGLQEILMEGSTWHALDKDELLEALTQPLSCEGPGLSRWLAMATLARAIVTKHQGHGHAAWLPESQLPPMAAQVFGLSKAGSAAALQADGRSFFAVYLQSGLEVLREFTIRAQCIVTYSWRSPKTIDLAQMQVLEAQVLQLAPLMRSVQRFAMSDQMPLCQG
ncbi:unnamed protein product [Effrenium voratum]|nr:unnamed protein product [Effrenium voratum]